FGPAFVADACDGLARRAPLRSAKRRLSLTQRAGLFVATAALGACLYLAPFDALFLTNIALLLIFTPVLAFRAYALAQAATRPVRPARPRRLLADHELPIYTLLAPLYREANMLPDLAAHLAALDYPAEKLDIKLVIEGDDAETLAAARALSLDARFDIIEVPPGEPRTKPKACNYALAFAKGDYVAIFDAEDAPARDQLRRAASVFAESPPDLACLQAALRFYNRDQNWLTRQFAIEYASHFGMLLPALERVDWPIPLGGTSNHFRIDVLRRVGAWDAYNVTEDADLGLRLASAGYRCRLFASATAEEATCTLRGWVGQRARWIKGYMQTFLVNNRRPGARLKRMGWRRYAGLEIFLGGAILTSFAYPAFIVLWTLEALWDLPTPMSISQGALAPANLALIIAGAAISLGSAAWGASAAGLGRGLTGAMLIATAPAYRILMGLAGVLAFWDLIRRPNHWRKTTHGLSRDMIRGAFSGRRPPLIPETRRATESPQFRDRTKITYRSTL
ncbi:MAG: glycosyltransferase family 2 protein, partial [Pseudomonadota bacterium]